MSRSQAAADSHDQQGHDRDFRGCEEGGSDGSEGRCEPRRAEEAEQAYRNGGRCRRQSGAHDEQEIERGDGEGRVESRADRHFGPRDEAHEREADRLDGQGEGEEQRPTMTMGEGQGSV